MVTYSAPLATTSWANVQHAAEVRPIGPVAAAAVKTALQLMIITQKKTIRILALPLPFEGQQNLEKILNCVFL